MKDEKIFDILENAENDSMDRLIDKCPEISDEQLDRILVMSERKFKMKDKETTRAKKDNIKVTENNVVEGVDRVRRPAWLRPMSAAASLILVIGIIAGSTALIKKGSKKPDSDHLVTPAATTETSTGTVTVTTGTAVVTTQPVTENSTDPLSISELVGKWLVESSKYNETIMIESDGTYAIHRENGDIVRGTVVTDTEEIGGTVHNTVNFYEAPNGEFSFGGYYDRNDPDVITIGNGGEEKLVRVSNDGNNSNTSDSDLNKFVGNWTYQIADGNTTVQENPKFAGTIYISEDGTFTASKIWGHYLGGVVTVNPSGGYVNGQTVPTLDFHNGDSASGEILLSLWYTEDNLNTLYDGNSGSARLIRGFTAENTPDVDINALTGEWTYQVADGNTTVDQAAKFNGTVIINADGTFTFDDTDGLSTNGTVIIDIEEIEGTKLTTVSFLLPDSSRSFGGYYDKNSPDTIPLGNGGMARLVRGKANGSTPVNDKDLAGRWEFQLIDDTHFNGSPLKYVVINGNGAYDYSDDEGNSGTGTYRIDTTEDANGKKNTEIYFYQNTYLAFEGHYDNNNPNVINIDNGIAKLVR